MENIETTEVRCLVHIPSISILREERSDDGVKHITYHIYGLNAGDRVFNATKSHIIDIADVAENLKRDLNLLLELVANDANRTA